MIDLSLCRALCEGLGPDNAQHPVWILILGVLLMIGCFAYLAISISHPSLRSDRFQMDVANSGGEVIVLAMAADHGRKTKSGCGSQPLRVR